MQLDHLEVRGPQTGLVVDTLRGLHIHVVADQALAGAVEAVGEVGRHGLPDDLHRLTRQAVLVDERLRGQDRRAGPVRGRRALQLGQRVVDHPRPQDVVQRVGLLELGVRVVDRVLVVLVADLGEMLCGAAVLLHVLAARRSEHPRRRREQHLGDLGHRQDVLFHRVGAVVVGRLQRTRLHLLEAERDRAVGEPAANRLRGKVQRGRSGRAVVVDVDDRDSAEAQLVERPLTRRRLAVDVTDVALLDRGVVDAGVLERLGAGLTRHVRVVPVLPAARLFELRHPHADDIDLV